MRRLVASCLLAALAGCASVSPPVAPERGWAFDGRLALTSGEDNLSGQLSWRHGAGTDELDLRTPLGQTVARIVRDPDGVTLETSDARYRAPDAEALTRERLGVAIPLSGLAWWVAGRPDPARPYTSNLPGGIVQDGWTIAYRDRFADGRPRKIDATRADLRLKLVIDAWSDSGTGSSP